MTVRTDNDEWYHAAHGLHDHAHHQAHRPLDICVPLWSRFRVEEIVANVTATETSTRNQHALAMTRVTCDYCGGTDHTDEEHEE